MSCGTESLVATTDPGPGDPLRTLWLLSDRNGVQTQQRLQRQHQLECSSVPAEVMMVGN